MPQRCWCFVTEPVDNMTEKNSFETQTFTYRDGSSAVWTREGGRDGRYLKDGVEVGKPADPASSTDGWGEYFKDYQRHIHKWEPLPGTQQMQHVMHAWDPPRRDDV